MSTARSPRALVATLALLALVAGCGTDGRADGGRARVSVPVPWPSGVQETPTVPTLVADPPCDPRASFRPGAPGETVARIRARGLLRVGASQIGYLLSYRDAVTGEMLGFEIDLVREIARDLFGDPGRVQFVSVNTADREPVLRDGMVDLVVGSMTMTCDRWTRVAFSAEYLGGGQRVLVDRRSAATSLDDLGGKRVCASATSTNIRTLAETRSRPLPVAAANATDCMVLLQQGQVDAVSTSDVILAGLAEQDRNTRIVGPRFTDEPCGIGMNTKATDLVRFVNGVLERLRGNGEWDRMYQKWFQRSLGPGTAPAPRYRD
ncbi:glutamate ABC transporter substrate-binding protein [Amycolatopsis samaneae]|uniref:Glutamate ABC transporter substrate-binding protein n=1 Tax=Amycolatopsis samaneae TaxID=664691 RepID=A0ABW5GSC8_9PSEU